MRQMKCPRCGGAIPVADHVAEVQCPACHVAFRMRKGSPGQAGHTPVSGSAAASPSQPRPPSVPPAGLPGLPPHPPAAIPAVPPGPSADLAAAAGPPAWQVLRHQRKNRQTLAAVIGIVVLLIGTGGGIYVVHHLHTRQTAQTDQQGAHEQPGPKRRVVIKHADPSDRPPRTGRQRQDEDQGPPPTITSGDSPVVPVDNTAPEVPWSVAEEADLKWSSDLKITADKDTGSAFLSGTVTATGNRIVQLATVEVEFFNAEGVPYKRPDWDADDLEFSLAALSPNEAVPFLVEFKKVSPEGFALDKTKFKIVRIKQAEENCRTVKVSEVSLVRGTDGKPDVLTCKITNPHPVGVINVMVWVDLIDHRGQPAGQVSGVVDDGMQIGAGQTVSTKVTVNEVIVAQRVEFNARGYGQAVGN